MFNVISIRMKKSLLLTVLLNVIIAMLFSGYLFPVEQTVNFPDTPAGKRSGEILRLLLDGTTEEMQKYITENFTLDFLKYAPMEDQLQVLNETRDAYKEFQLKAVKENSNLELSALLWSPVTETWLRFDIKVEKDPPHKVLTIRMGLGTPLPDKPPAKKMTDRELADAIKIYMEKLVEKDIFSGTVLLAKNGEILFKGAYGLASKRYSVPNRIDTKFNLGSMNKMFTAVAIAQLVEKGKLGYDELIGKYLDGSWIQKETAEKVKIKHLLTHASGLGSYFNKKFWESSRLLFRNLDDYKPLIIGDKPRFEPGTQSLYSNTGMFLLGVIIGKVSGMDYFDYIRENIYKPAGMVNSDSFEMDRPVPNLAIGYVKRYTPNGSFWRNNIFDHVVKGGPAGGGFSTVEDLLAFAQALRNNKLISKESVELLTSPKPEVNSPNYGYGFTISEKGGDRIVGHSGGFTGIRSDLSIFLKSGYTVAIMSNYTSGMTAVKEKITELILANI
jgi:CubicO group peptidase (beta-lactamase class C family)